MGRKHFKTKEGGVVTAVLSWMYAKMPKVFIGNRLWSQFVEKSHSHDVSPVGTVEHRVRAMIPSHLRTALRLDRRY